jgi:hypothetical protein
MTEPNRRRRWYRLGALALLLLIGYGTYRLVRPDPNLKKVKQLQADFAAHAKDWSPDQRQAKGLEMRTAMEKLSTSQRDALRAEGRKRFEEEMKRYASMSQAEKNRYLDERIDAMEKMRQQMGNGPRPNGGQGTFGSGPDGNAGQSMSQEDRDRRRKERLDQTTPEFRATMDQFRRDMANRRQQRGMGR